MITDQTNKVVWRWDNNDPFGANVPDEDPDGDGIKFTCNLRFPGQYFDKETSLAYNYFRDYDPSIGRYTESDPVGLAGGINTYEYVASNPLVWIDRSGLATYMCMKPLHSFPRSWDANRRSIVDIQGNPFYHQYLCVSDGSGGYTCGGQDRGESKLGALFALGVPSSGDTFNSNTCKINADNSCVDNCVKRKILNPQRPRYGIPFGTDCQEWSDDVLSQCKQSCKGNQ